MPTLLKNRVNQNRPWAAKAKKDGVHYFLGYFATKEEAAAVEKQFWQSFGYESGQEYGAQKSAYTRRLLYS